MVLVLSNVSAFHEKSSGIKDLGFQLMMMLEKVN